MDAGPLGEGKDPNTCMMLGNPTRTRARTGSQKNVGQPKQHIFHSNGVVVKKIVEMMNFKNLKGNEFFLKILLTNKRAKQVKCLKLEMDCKPPVIF